MPHNATTEEPMYRTDPELDDAYAETARGVRIAEARDAFIDRRVRELRLAVVASPLTAMVDSMWAIEARVPIAVDMVAWVLETYGDPHVALAKALTYGTAAARLRDAYTEARATAEADAKADDYWLDDATVLFQRGAM